jgi:hypothetical protein
MRLSLLRSSVSLSRSYAGKAARVCVCPALTLFGPAGVPPSFERGDRQDGEGRERKARSPTGRNAPRDGEQREWRPRESRGDRSSFGGGGGETGGAPWRPREGASSSGGERREWRPRESTGGGDRREFRSRESSGGDGGGEKREWRPRPEGGGERREWKPREEGGERREWKPREEGGERREWKPREGGGEGGGRPPFRPRDGGEGGGRAPWRPREDRDAQSEGGQKREWRPRGEGEGGEKRSFGERGGSPGRYSGRPVTFGVDNGEGRPFRKPFGEGRSPDKRSRGESGEQRSFQRRDGAGGERRAFEPRPSKPEKEEEEEEDEDDEEFEDEGEEAVKFDVGALSGGGKEAGRMQGGKYSGGFSPRPLRFDQKKDKTKQAAGEDEFDFSALVEAEEKRDQQAQGEGKKKKRQKEEDDDDESEEPLRHFANKPAAVGDNMRKFEAQRNRPAPLFKPAKAELLSAVRKWFDKKSADIEWLVHKVAAEHGGMDAERGRLTEEMVLFFRHYARLVWLIERRKLEVTPDLMWGAFVVLLKGADAQQVGKALHDNMEDANLTSSRLVQICEEGLDHEEMPQGVKLECPPQVFQALEKQWGQPLLVQELLALQKPRETQVRVNALKATPEVLTKRLTAAGFKVQPGHFAPLSLRIQGQKLLETAEYEEGLFEMQAEGALLVGMMVDPTPKMQVLDMCAGAGGKTM